MSKKKVTKKVETKPPKGLSITRNGNTFTFSWKIGDKNYDEGQKLEYTIDFQNDKWKSIKVGKTTTSKSVTIDNFKKGGNTPSRIPIVSFRVKGERKNDKKETKKEVISYKYSMSEWVYKTIDILPPNQPKAQLVLNESSPDRCTFSWGVSDPDSGAKWFSIVRYQTRLKNNTSKNKSEKDPKWSNITTSRNASGGFSQPESSIKLQEPGASYTREFRIYSAGPGGINGKVVKKKNKQKGFQITWTTVSHTYAKPKKPSVESAVIVDNGANGYTCDIKWKAPQPSGFPVDSVTAQYCIVVPKNGKYIPDSGYSWKNVVSFYGKTKKDTSEYDSAYFLIDEKATADQAVFVRVISHHDTPINDTPSSAFLCTVGKKTASFSLAAPSTPTVDPQGDSNLISVTAKNNSQLAGSKMAVVYHSVDNPDNKIVVGIMDSSGTQTIRIPSNTKAFSIGVYAFIGSVTSKEKDGYTEYTVTSVMRSSTVYVEDGSVPMPPTNVLLSHTSQGIIHVSWDWSWASSDAAELSWSNYKDAWESTSEPSKYRISNINNGEWNITGLAIGEEWFVRVRLINTSDSNGETVSRWSDPVSLYLSSSPIKPTVDIKPAFISENGRFNVAWGYITTDNTPQRNAIVALEDGRVLATTDSKTSVTIDTSTEEFKTQFPDWGKGTYNLKVQVQSESGLTSEWSDLYPLDVVDPVSCTVDFPISEDYLIHNYICYGYESPKTINVDSLSKLQSGSTFQINLSDNFEVSQTDPHVYTFTKGTSAHITGPSDGVLINDTGKALSRFDISYDGDLTFTCTFVEPFDSSAITEPYIPGTVDVYQMSVVIDIDEDTPMQRRAVTVEVPEDSADISEITDDTPTTTKTIVTNVLTKLPFTFTATGVGDSGTITATIIRNGPYNQPGPDENDFVGFDGEVVYSYYQVGEAPITIDRDSLIRGCSLDDGGHYILKVSGKDDHDQVDDHYEFEFDVDWGHKAIEPTADIQMHYYDDEQDDMFAVITPIAPEGTQPGDYASIYRLSADKPQLIYDNAIFGKSYVDPYPTIGEMGGHRIAFKSLNDDFITEDNTPAWTDYDYGDDDVFESLSNIISFGSDKVLLMLNANLDNSWKKDFEETKYLGGSVQGDWNPAVSRTGSISTNIITNDIETIKSLRRLAVYSGPCHVRTKDGSNYIANVDVSESIPYETYYTVEGEPVKIMSYSLSITRVDPEIYDGVTLESWLGEE